MDEDESCLLSLADLLPFRLPELFQRCTPKREVRQFGHQVRRPLAYEQVEQNRFFRPGCRPDQRQPLGTSQLELGIPLLWPLQP